MLFPVFQASTAFLKAFQVMFISSHSLKSLVEEFLLAFTLTAFNWETFSVFNLDCSLVDHCSNELMNLFNPLVLGVK